MPFFLCFFFSISCRWFSVPSLPVGPRSGSSTLLLASPTYTSHISPTIRQGVHFLMPSMVISVIFGHHKTLGRPPRMFCDVQNCSHGRIDPRVLYARAHHRNVNRNIGVIFAFATINLTSPLPTPSPQVPRTSPLPNEPVAMRTRGTAVMRITALRRARGSYAAPLRADITSALHVVASHAATLRADETSPPGVGTSVMRLVVFRRAAWQAEASRRTANVSYYLLLPFFISIFLKIRKILPEVAAE